MLTSSEPDAVPVRGRRKQGRTPSAGLGDAEEADEVEEEDRGALGPFLLLDLLEVEEDDEEASQTTAEHARWWLSPLVSGTRERRRWWIEVLGNERVEEAIDGFGGSALVGLRRKSRERVGENLDQEEIPRWDGEWRRRVRERWDN